jgi:choline monooxygenase
MPVDLVTTLPARWYTDPGVFERERRPIFGSSWVHIAYEHQLRRPGDYVAENLAGWPIFVRRNDDNSLAGFYNLCPHRAGPIVWDGEGHQANMVCRYHGWAFRDNGRLLNARDFGCDVPDQMDLQRIQVESWRGMVFVCLDPDVAPLHEWLGAFPGEVADVPLESYRFHSRSVRNVACNWKTYGDNFMEGYHLPTVHPAMSRDADALNYKVIIRGDRRWNIHVMPPRDESTFGVFGWFWPTFAFDVFPGGFAVERWLPRGHSHSDLIFEYFFADDTEHDVEAIIKFSEQVADEDARVCEHVQRNLDSGNYDVGVLSPKWEEGIKVFHELIREAVGPLE